LSPLVLRLPWHLRLHRRGSLRLRPRDKFLVLRLEKPAGNRDRARIDCRALEKGA